MSQPVTSLEAARVPVATVEMVDPETAKRWLGHNTDNRKLRERSVVAAYARDMRSGNWPFTGEAIKFAIDGELLDGQHRLHAVLQSGVTLPFLVVRNIEKVAQDVMDAGAPRRASDALDRAGHRNSQRLASAAVAVITDLGQGRGATRTTTSEIMDIIEQDQSIRWIVNDVLPSFDLASVMTPTVAFYTYWRFNKIDAQSAAEFFNALSTLVGLPKGSPILALHRRLTRDPANRRGAGYAYRQEVLACTFRAWNAWRKGEELNKIQLSYGEFGRLNIPEPK